MHLPGECVLLGSAPRSPVGASCSRLRFLLALCMLPGGVTGPSFPCGRGLSPLHVCSRCAHWWATPAPSSNGPPRFHARRPQHSPQTASASPDQVQCLTFPVSSLPLESATPVSIPPPRPHPATATAAPLLPAHRGAGQSQKTSIPPPNPRPPRYAIAIPMHQPKPATLSRRPCSPTAEAAHVVAAEDNSNSLFFQGGT